jgi:hypothetical protein
VVHCAGGCTFAEDADQIADEARIIWDAVIDNRVLSVHAVPAGKHEQGFDLRDLAAFATIVIDPGGTEHIALSDGTMRLRIDVHSGSLLSGAVRLEVICNDIKRLDVTAPMLAQLASLCRHRRFMHSHFPQEKCTSRWIKALRVYDGLSAGASQRDIAIALYGARRVADEWHGDSDAMRAYIRRLIKTARALASGGYSQHIT